MLLSKSLALYKIVYIKMKTIVTFLLLLLPFVTQSPQQVKLSLPFMGFPNGASRVIINMRNIKMSTLVTHSITLQSMLDM